MAGPIEYFVPTALVVIIMLERIAILKAIIFLNRRIAARLGRPPMMLTWLIREKIHDIVSQQVVFFTRGDNLANLNRAMQYVQENEHTNRMKVVTVMRDRARIPPRLENDLKFLDEAYPEIDIEFVVIEGTFTPELVNRLSEKWKIPTNFMFIGTPAGKLAYNLADLSGVV